jgi:hypothetical protein
MLIGRMQSVADWRRQWRMPKVDRKHRLMFFYFLRFIPGQSFQIHYQLGGSARSPNGIIALYNVIRRWIGARERVLLVLCCVDSNSFHFLRIITGRGHVDESIRHGMSWNRPKPGGHQRRWAINRAHKSCAGCCRNEMWITWRESSGSLSIYIH